MVRKIVIVVVAAMILAGGMFGFKTLSNSKKPMARKVEKRVATVFTETVKNEKLPVVIEATGALKALNRVELFSEVQGVMQPDAGKFKAGTRFSTGERLVGIRSTDFEASLKSQKSNLQNLITAALPDLRMDYPDAFDRWNNYLRNLDLEKPIAALPKTGSDQEKLFITGRNIYTTYYNIKNAEVVLGKYSLSAPFNGVLTQAMVTPGTVIRPGQKLGEFIDPSVYEMETPVSVSMIQHLKVGQEVELNSTVGTGRTWQGRIARINALVNQGTQMVNVYIQVSGDGLEEGMFMTADISATELENAFEIERSVLFDGDQVYVAGDSVLIQQTVQPIHFKEKTVIVRGLSDGDEVLTKMTPGAYPGMRIIIYNESE